MRGLFLIKPMTYYQEENIQKIELSKKLANKFPDKSQIISELIIKLEESGYLSEARYKEMIIKKLLKRGSSHRAISNELSLHNIHTTSNEIDEWQSSLGLSKKETINNLIQKKLKLTPNKALQKKRESIIRFLLSKGYTYEEIKPSIEDRFKDHF